ncbi:MAG: family 78 glycoside hydrolase catalytic domain [Promethearchaeota archaeon]
MSISNRIEVYDLKVENLRNPMGLDVALPFFSWKIKINEDARQDHQNSVYNLKQSAYRIIVTSNIELITKNVGDIWDSGKIYDDINFNRKYDGPALKSDRKYYWKVKVWLINNEDNRLKTNSEEDDGNIEEYESDWSAVAYWTTGFFDIHEFKGKWIGPKISLRRRAEHIFNWHTRSPAIYLRRGFEIDTGINNGKKNKKVIKRATLYATALGIYRLYLNGLSVSDRYFAPEWTDYRKTILYQCYDVSNYIKEGKNVIGAILSDGWYSGRIGLGISRFYGAEIGLKAYLVIEFEENSEGDKGDNSGNVLDICEIMTDASWEYCSEGPIRSANLIDGETYDSRMELKDWSRQISSNSDLSNVGTQDDNSEDKKTWKKVKIIKSLKLLRAHLKAQKSEPVIRIGEFIPKDKKDINEIGPGKYIINIGQNISGFIRIRITPEICEANSQIIIRYGEILDEKGRLYTKNLRTAKCTDEIFYDGRDLLDYHPLFTFRGFQFIEITGLKANIPADKFINDKIIVGIALSSGTGPVGTLTTSHEKLNKLLENIYWTARNNQISIPTDCPQRDERMGWMGDAHIFAKSAMLILDMASFYRKWIEDIRDAQLKDGVYPDVVPYTPRLMVKMLKSSPAWADCGVNLPLFHFQFYGDIRVLKAHYKSAKKFVDYILKKNPDFIWTKASGRNYGDWLNGDNIKYEGYPNKGGNTPKDVFATLFFGRMVENLSKMAYLLDNQTDSQYYNNLAEKIKEAFRENFMDDDLKIKGDTQTGYALALDFGFIPEKSVNKVREHLLRRLKDYDYRLSTGFLGTLSLMDQMVEMGREDLAYKLLLYEDMPSWFYMINNGATTIWERWDSFVPKRGMQSASMTSFDHYAFGSIAEWIYKNLLGLRWESHNNDSLKIGAGFRKVIIKPVFSEAFTFVKGTFKSISGDFSIEWRANKESTTGLKYKLNCKIPINTQATIILPIESKDLFKINGKQIEDFAALLKCNLEEQSAKSKMPNMIEIEIGSGNYTFEF